MVLLLQSMGLPTDSLHSTVVEMDLNLRETKQDTVIPTKRGQVLHHIAKSKVSSILGMSL